MLPGNTLHSIFEVRACESPDRVAVVCADEQITYGELNQRAEQHLVFTLNIKTII
jgi:non-ribosomal peptide synthetase component F